ncbi:Sensor histidine kinase BtsS [bioreactor metagenome]|uniref:histidine kinase n=1 Tax=bioreactor metagenome TaxID=1076179 RepID=A0A644TUL5_9ZZZZ|nr:LytS/YhcK type 5TM receptor domain-containing protein [Negativicutes bacterium]
MKNLIIAILYNFSVIGLSAYMITRLPPVRRILLERSIRWHDRFFLILIFGSLSILGNGLGIPILGSLANSRIVGPIVGGLLGGPIVGLGAGIMGGFIRYHMGGFTMIPSVTANVIAGLIAGLVHMRYGSRNITLPIAGLTAFVCEAVLKLMVIFMSKPFEAALELEKIIAVPTITANCLATLLFIYIFREIYKDQDNAYANSAHQALRSIRRTNNLLQQGLDKESAQIMADVIYQELKPDAVCITDNNNILAFRGVGGDHHVTGLPSTSIKQLQKHHLGEGIFLSSNPEDIGCSHSNCPLAIVLSVPLAFDNKLLGSISLFKTKNKQFLVHEIELVRGLADFTSSQLFANQIAQQTRLLEQAEYNALKAQVNPHFLFNTLATIRILILKDPHNARLLLKDLSELLRQSLNQKQEFSSLKEELDTIKRYLRLEKARFGDRITVHWDVPGNLLSSLIPVFTLQPLVENAIKHGLSPRKEGGNIYIRIWAENSFLYLCVEDDGVGLNPTRNPHQSLPKTGTGIGLVNITQRLRIMYSNTAAFTLSDHPGGGAQALVKLPLPEQPQKDDSHLKEGQSV